MTEPLDPNRTVDDVPSTPPDSLDAGLAAGFGRPADGPGSALEKLRASLGPLRPLLLAEAEGESAHVVKPKSDAMPAPEQTGSRYQLQGEIARGGMGAVLRGRDTDLGRDLAVKVLLEKHADRPEVVRRFIEEAQIGGQLQHPGVVPVYDIGHFGNRPFFTMKLVKGQTLSALLAGRQQPSEDRPHLLTIALKVAQALAYAHAKGVIHRDLKPANIMVGAFGEVQVMDWGLAKVLPRGGIADEERAASRGHQPPGVEPTVIRTARNGSTGSSTDTEAGTLLGTPAYMPPEQANGDVALIDCRADVFGLGAILCEILTGQPPYVGRSPEEVRLKAANADLADALTRLAGCGASAELLELTWSCLAPEASDRPKDAQAVADALTAYLDGVQARLHRAELAEAEAKARAAEEARRRRLMLALAAVVLLAVTLASGAGLWLKADRDARQAQLTRQVHDALNRVTALREKAKAASVGGAALFGQAREQAQRALALVENGPADQTLVDQVKQLQAELDEEEKDRHLIAALEAARLAQAETVVGESRFARERAIPLFREAFAAYGMAVGEGEPAAAAARLRQRPATVRQAAVAALQEWTDLAANSSLGLAEPHYAWLRRVAAALEPEEEWARHLRTTLEQRDLAKRRVALEQLAREADLEKVPVSTLTRLAARLQEVQGHSGAVALLRRTQQRFPGDFWVNQDLGLALKAMPGEVEEAVRYLTAAVALRPESPGAHLNLGLVLQTKGQVEEAAACYRKAIALDPNYAMAHNNLGLALQARGQWEQAIACYRTAIGLDPNFAAASNNLGTALQATGQGEQAITCYRTATALDPKNARAHYNLGTALQAKGQWELAIACYRMAIKINPMEAVAHCNLGQALSRQGHFAESLAAYQRGHELGTKQPGWRYPSAAWVQIAERLAALEAKLPAFRQGKFEPADTAQRLGLATVCRTRQLYHAAACLYAAAFAADPRLADQLNAGHRYDAACSAALAAAGRAEDAARLDDQERARLRQQALAWLRADLTLRQKQLQSSKPGEADQAQAALRHWQTDADLAGIREEAALTKLPAQEQEDCRRLWADVATLLKPKDSTTPKGPKP